MLQPHGGLVMTRHSFDTVIATQVGVNAAVIYQNMMFWCEKNFANGHNIYDGYCWTYNSRRAWSDLFTYFSAAQIRTAIAKLISSGLVVKGHYNKNHYDRTIWYAPTETAAWLAGGVGHKPQVHLSKIANGLVENSQPIPVINTDINADKVYKEGAIPVWLPMEAWNGFLEMRKKQKKPMTDRAIKRAINKLDELRRAGNKPEDVLDQSTMHCWADLYAIKDKENGKANRAGADRTANHNKGDGLSSALNRRLGLGSFASPH
jgi:hypothetical protein